MHKRKSKIVLLTLLAGGVILLKENHFITHYQGQCTHCHALNKATGE